MTHYELLLGDAGELEALAGRAAAAGIESADADERSLALLDPAGNRIVLSEVRR